MNDLVKKLVAIGKAINTIERKMATKDDIRNMATKDDLKGMATKNDLKGMATKDDLSRLEAKLIQKIEESEMEIIATVDKHKADKVEVKRLQEQVNRPEDNAGLPPYPTQ